MDAGGLGAAPRQTLREAGLIAKPGAAVAAAAPLAALSRALALSPPFLPLLQHPCGRCVGYGQGAAHGRCRPAEGGDLAHWQPGPVRWAGVMGRWEWVAEAEPERSEAERVVRPERRAGLAAETAAAEATGSGQAEAGRTERRAAGKRRNGAQSGRPARSEAGRGGGLR